MRSVAGRLAVVLNVPNPTNTLSSYIAYPVVPVAASKAKIRYVSVPFLGTLFFLTL